MHTRPCIDILKHCGMPAWNPLQETLGRLVLRESSNHGDLLFIDGLGSIWVSIRCWTRMINDEGETVDLYIPRKWCLLSTSPCCSTQATCMQY